MSYGISSCGCGRYDDKIAIGEDGELGLKMLDEFSNTYVKMPRGKSIRPDVSLGEYAPSKKYVEIAGRWNLLDNEIDRKEIVNAVDTVAGKIRERLASLGKPVEKV